MRLTLGLLCSVVAITFGAACGQPKADDKCDASGFLCADAATALECRAGAWVALPCKGPSGCTRTADLVKCDMTGNIEGDNCASTLDTKGLCTADGTATLQCHDGKLVKMSTCSSCSVNGDTVQCTP